jgi:hypothetical protein
VTENACTELESGACRGHHYHLQLVELIDAGLIERVRLGAADGQSEPVWLRFAASGVGTSERI